MKQCLFILLVAMGFAAGAQNLSLTFTSITDAKFFVYLNGTLQNERSSGMVTLNGLEEKDYHVRIVIDDPFVVAVTRTIKPDPKRSEYTVQFNAVRERVYLKPAATPSKRQVEEESIWVQTEDNNATQQEEPRPQKQRTSLRRNQVVDTATQRILNHIKTPIVEE